MKNTVPNMMGYSDGAAALTWNSSHESTMAPIVRPRPRALRLPLYSVPKPMKKKLPIAAIQGFFI